MSVLPFGNVSAMHHKHKNKKKNKEVVKQEVAVNQISLLIPESLINKELNSASSWKDCENRLIVEKKFNSEFDKLEESLDNKLKLLEESKIDEVNELVKNKKTFKVNKYKKMLRAIGEKYKDIEESINNWALEEGNRLVLESKKVINLSDCLTKLSEDNDMKEVLKNPLGFTNYNTSLKESDLDKSNDKKLKKNCKDIFKEILEVSENPEAPKKLSKEELDGLNTLGMNYLYGKNGYEKNPSKACDCFQRSTQGGDINAEWNYALALMEFCKCNEQLSTRDTQEIGKTAFQDTILEMIFEKALKAKEAGNKEADKLVQAYEKALKEKKENLPLK
jgi:hypothetical protein